MKQRRRRRSLALTTIAVAAAASVTPSSAILDHRHSKQAQPGHHLRRKLPQHQQQQQQRDLVDNPNNHYCGTNWGVAYANCNEPCPSKKDEDCGPGKTCFGYVDCTPPYQNEPAPSPSSQNQPSLMATYEEPTKEYSEHFGHPVPTYINSLPIAPSVPSTPAPFAIPMPTPNTMANPTNNYCGYGWEGAMKECYHSCPSGLDAECPGGRSCHTWLTCTQATEDPALYNVCGTNWGDAASKCSTRCFEGDDTVCPEGESCFGAVTDCEGKLPELTAVDVGLEEKSYTIEEIELMLEEELQKEEDEKALADPMNWWCGTSWSNMLETCEKRCETDADCAPNSWTKGYCYRTTGGPENCQEPGVAVKEKLPPGSRWCGTSWKVMLETCEAMCESDEDCKNAGLGQCFEAPDTCKYVGVPVQEPAPEGTLWCGSDYDDAKTSCHKECPDGDDTNCPPGMSCFSESLCTTEGQPVEVVTAAVEGFHCGKDWGAAHSCAITCESDDDCADGTNCYWVACESGSTPEEEEEDTPNDTTTTKPTISNEEVSCSPEVFLCPSGEYVGRSPQLDCEFYPCPGSSDPEPEPEPEPEATSASEEPVAASEEVDLSSQEEPAATSEQAAESYQEPVAASSEVVSSDSEAAATSDSSGGSEESDSEVSEAGTVYDFYDKLGAEPDDPVGSDWGTKSLIHSCQSGDGNCGVCEGDCNSDDDCQDGLKCFSRGQGELTAVPGCISGGEGDKPGMDYCYMEEPPTTTTTTTTTTTATTTTTTKTPEPAGWVDEIVDDSSPGVELYYTRECSIALKCGECEGDCDVDSHCTGGLKCFSRADGSVDAVPGCFGLGTPGMDYCYDPDSPIIQPYTSTADVPVPIQEDSGAEIVSEVLAMSDSAFCGFTLEQVNDNCHNAKPCSSGDSGECEGLEICIQDTNCGMQAPTTTTTSTVASAAFAESCDDLCLNILPAEWCPDEPNLPNCLEVAIGEFCESDGECGTDDKLDNCDGTFDIYARVECSESKLSQGQIMRATESPTSSPSVSPTTVEPTALPTISSTTVPPTSSPVTPATTSYQAPEAASMEMASASTNQTETQSANEDQVETYQQSAAVDLTQQTGSFTFDRSPQKTDATEETGTPSKPSTSSTSMYWTNPSTEYKWESTFDSPVRNSLPQQYRTRLSVLLGLAACFVAGL